MATATARILVRSRKAIAKASTVKFRLFSAGNPKVAKGEKKGIWTVILHLSPASLSGWNVCPMATDGCRAACLNTAGRGGIAAGGNLTYAALINGRRNAVQLARLRKTRLYFERRAEFMALLRADIAKARKIARKHKVKLAIRLNGTSDIRWELSGIIGENPDVQFYDYTKLPNRKVSHLPNYHLTFSLADGNLAQAEIARANGINVAVVFRDKATVARMMALDSTIIDGDETDLRFLDGKHDFGRIIALYAKGNAKRDTSGFVFDCHPFAHSLAIAA